jgi:hypothetical protein
MRRTVFAVTSFLACGFALSALAGPTVTSLKAIVTEENIIRVDDATPRIRGGLYVTFEETGLPPGTHITYEIVADAAADYVCAKAGSNPTSSAESPQHFEGKVGATATFTADATGRVQGTFSLPPLGPGAFTCPSGQVPTLGVVSYSNVRLHEVTNDMWSDLPGAFTHPFIAISGAPRTETRTARASLPP